MHSVYLIFFFFFFFFANLDSLDIGLYGEFLATRTQATTVLKNHCVDYQTNNDTTYFALHRKPKLSAKLNKQRADQNLIARLNDQFPDATYIFGNYSASNVRYQEPIREIGFRRILKKQSISVFLADEFCTSRICPECNNRSLVTFKNVENPRPHRQRT
jgi:hypothetical protein